MWLEDGGGHREPFVLYIYWCPPTGDCARRVTISATIVEEVVKGEVQRLVSHIRERVSTESVVEVARTVYEAAQDALEAATRIALASGLADGSQP